MSAPKIDIWIEGYSVTGNHAEAQLIGTIEAENLREAAQKFFATHPSWLGHKFFDAERMTYWGGRLFDNEQDARASFG